MPASWQHSPSTTDTKQVTFSEMYPHYCSLPLCFGFSRRRNNGCRSRHSNRQPCPLSRRASFSRWGRGLFLVPRGSGQAANYANYEITEITVTVHLIRIANYGDSAFNSNCELR